jgi:hypothetical protein
MTRSVRSRSLIPFSLPAALTLLLWSGATGALAQGAPNITATCDAGTVKVVGTDFLLPANSLQISIALPVEGSEVFPDVDKYFAFTPSTFTQNVSPKAQRPPGVYLVSATTYMVVGSTARTVQGANTRMSLPCPPAPSPSPSASPTPSPTPPPLDSKLACNPTAAPAGGVITAVGTGFPVATKVLLTWKTGVNATPQLTTVTDGTGGFQTPILLFPHDVTGPRTLAALPDPQNLNPFKEVDAECLVTVGSVQPRDFAWRR